MLLLCVIFLNSKLKAFCEGVALLCSAHLVSACSLLHRLKWEIQLWEWGPQACGDAAVTGMPAHQVQLRAPQNSCHVLEVTRRAGVWHCWWRTDGPGQPAFSVQFSSTCGVFTGSTLALSWRPHRHEHIFPIRGFLYLSLLRNIFDIVNVEATGAFFEPGAKLTQLCFAQFYLKTMTTTSEMSLANAMLLHYLLFHLLNAMVPAAKIPLSDSSSCQRSHLVVFRK